jgi:hypothetical protein
MCGLLVSSLASRAEAQVTYASQRDAAVKNCEATPAFESHSGLLFNPDGYRSYYGRSACYQQAAVLFRERGLCAKVWRRFSPFGSSWGYSEANCKKLVAEGLAKDSTELAQMRAEYEKGPVRLVDIRLERNGNGRDIDVIPTFSPGYASGYLLRLELVDRGRAVLIDSSGYHLSDNNNIRGFIRTDSIRARVPEFVLGQTHHVRATLILALGFGGQAGMRSDEFTERHFPLAARSQSIERDVRP